MVFPLPAYLIAQAIRIPHPALSSAQLGRERLPVHFLMDLAYILGCEPEDLIGWANDGIDTDSLDAECPCIEDGVNTAALSRFHLVPVPYR
jgi:hypothetical protein